MPEGDTIFRAARTLNRALAGQVVTKFETQLPQLARVDYDTPLAGRTVERVDAAGKWMQHVFLRRPDPAHPHADERKLAHLPARRSVAAQPEADAHGSLHRGVRGGGFPGAGGGVSYRGHTASPPHPANWVRTCSRKSSTKTQAVRQLRGAAGTGGGSSAAPAIARSQAWATSTNRRSVSPTE